MVQTARHVHTRTKNSSSHTGSPVSYTHLDVYKRQTFRCSALEKAALSEQAARCGLSTSEYCRSLSLGGRPRERYTEEERELLRDIARLKGTLQRLNNYFGGRQYREVFEENRTLITELQKILSR